MLLGTVRIRVCTYVQYVSTLQVCHDEFQNNGQWNPSYEYKSVICLYACICTFMYNVSMEKKICRYLGYKIHSSDTDIVEFSVAYLAEGSLVQ